jgi:hypothetical protein
MVAHDVVSSLLRLFDGPINSRDDTSVSIGDPDKSSGFT